MQCKEDMVSMNVKAVLVNTNILRHFLCSDTLTVYISGKLEIDLEGVQLKIAP